MIPRPSISTRNDPLFPYTTLFRSHPLYEGGPLRPPLLFLVEREGAPALAQHHGLHTPDGEEQQQADRQQGDEQQRRHIPKQLVSDAPAVPHPAAEELAVRPLELAAALPAGHRPAPEAAVRDVLADAATGHPRQGPRRHDTRAPA